MGAVIQAIGRPDFEDGMRTGVQLEVSNDLQCVRTKPVVRLAEPSGQAKTMGAVWYTQVGFPEFVFVADQSPRHSSTRLVL